MLGIGIGNAKANGAREQPQRNGRIGRVCRPSRSSQASTKPFKHTPMNKQAVSPTYSTSFVMSGQK